MNTKRRITVYINEKIVAELEAEKQRSGIPLSRQVEDKLRVKK